ncbi:M23 family metallopeptidase [Kovacikia minuta CCNUW1]|uniref:M23 family metallopeptidase n=1 Tax=Kovacikia minuta TaxID=2931930 RepID=UPI001CC9FA1A|nr:M23 family metallopeptidase [Kovacikia minuta]UBF26708.1 M23 family metallopeptidase [Kovacikia minuta CCNUW1]
MLKVKNQIQITRRHTGLVGIAAFLVVLLLCTLKPDNRFSLSAAAADPPTSKTTTAIIVSATNRPLRVLGSDGKEHLEYDLLFTNLLPSPITLTSIEVSTEKGQQLLELSGDSLKAVTQPLLSPTPTNQIPASGTLATLIDVIVPPDKVPQRVTHRITYDFPPNTPDHIKALIGSLEIQGPELVVNPFQAIVIASPLSGNGWFNASGCCDDASSPHRFSRLIAGGARYVKPEIFAIDWIRLQDNQDFSGDGTRNEQYFAFGANVSSVANGTVIAVRDDMPEETPNQTVKNVKKPLDFVGNSVVVQIQPGIWATYAHLQTGSIKVRVGDRVKTGQFLGKLGNSGNSTAPHLHFQLSDGPDNTTANSLPFVIDQYRFVGLLDPGSNPPSTLRIEGKPHTERKTHPLITSVTDFR